MLVESDWTEFCRVLLRLIDEEKITFRIGVHNRLVFMITRPEPDVEDWLALIEQPGSRGIAGLAHEWRGRVCHGDTQG